MFREIDPIFASRDFARPDDLATYNEFGRQLMSELRPEGILQEIHAAEAFTAAWRLHRLAKLEEQLVDPDSKDQPDPMAQPERAKLQASIDRARTQYNNLLRRATAEVRRLQAERRSKPVAVDSPKPAITEQTQSAPDLPADTPDLDPEADPLSPESIRQSWEAMNNDAEYQAALLEACRRGAARRAREGANTEQTQSTPPREPELPCRQAA